MGREEAKSRPLDMGARAGWECGFNSPTFLGLSLPVKNIDLSSCPSCYTDVCRVRLFILTLQQRDVCRPCAVSPSHIFQQRHLPHTGPPITHRAEGLANTGSQRPSTPRLVSCPSPGRSVPQGLALNLAFRGRVFQQTLIPCN